MSLFRTIHQNTEYLCWSDYARVIIWFNCILVPYGECATNSVLSQKEKMILFIKTVQLSLLNWKPEKKERVRIALQLKRTWRWIDYVCAAWSKGSEAADNELRNFLFQLSLWKNAMNKCINTVSTPEWSDLLEPWLSSQCSRNCHSSHEPKMWVDVYDGHLNMLTITGKSCRLFSVHGTDQTGKIFVG